MDSEFSSYDKLKSMLQNGSSGARLQCLRNITNNFSVERRLGEGGFGTVYKGVLQNGETVAVKRFNSSIPGVKDRQFENEAYHLMRLKHPNIVQLVGCCSETENEYIKYNGKHVYAEKLERLLCLEYMPNGSLREYLSDECSELEWDTRYKIIEGICYGLRYLHDDWQLNAPIVHMDLKPANILLDNNMVPKIADFGLSRLFSKEKTRTYTMSCHGTLGYMAPEYINNGLITTKLDIFSLGVIIIEIVTGHRNYPDETGISSQEYIELVLKKWRNRQMSMHTSLIDCEQIRRCIQIGLLCVKFNRSKRPTISQIIKMLHGLETADFSGKKEQSQQAQQQIISLQRLRNGGIMYSKKSQSSVYKTKISSEKTETKFPQIDLASKSSEMAIDLLSDIQPGQFHWTICVSISRMWEFRGKSDDGVIKHLDLVIIDKKGTSMYVEIPPDSIPILKPQLKEGKVVTMKKFVVEQAKPEYRVVLNPYMLRLNKRTMITTVEPEPSMFPKFTCMLTPLSELEQYRGSTERFLDIIGQITQVSNVANFHTVAGTMQMRRKITVRDINGIAINLFLSGARAIEFDGDKVYNLGQETAVVAIFVSTLMKKGLAGQPSYLSGTSACRWYINDFQILAIQEYYNMLPSEVDAIDKVEISDTKTTQQQVEQKRVLQLKDMDPFEQMNTKFQCTVTITKVSLNQGWYYSACKICNTGCYYISGRYKCGKKDCPSNEAQDRYKFCFMAADETYELEFIAFDQKAQQLIGKPLQRLQSMYGKFDTPAEISNLVGQTYTFIIKISARSIYTDEPSYEVVSIKEQFGKQANVPVFQKTNPLPATSYFQGTQINLPSPIQIQPKKIQRKNQHQGIIITDPSEGQYQQTIDNKVTEYPKNKTDNSDDRDKNLGIKRGVQNHDDDDFGENMKSPASSKKQRF